MHSVEPEDKVFKSNVELERKLCKRFMDWGDYDEIRTTEEEAFLSPVFRRD